MNTRVSYIKSIFLLLAGLTLIYFECIKIALVVVVLQVFMLNILTAMFARNSVATTQIVRALKAKGTRRRGNGKR